MTRSSKVHTAEVAALTIVLATQAYLFARPLHGATNYDEAVYLAAVDALRHGQALGSGVFAAQFPGFYDLLRGLSYVTGIGVVALRSGLLAVALLGTVGGWLVGRRFGGPVGGLLVASFLSIAPPLDLFGSQVIADTPALALMAVSLGLATLAGPLAAMATGAVLAASFSVKLTAITVLPAVAWQLRSRLAPGIAGFMVVVGVILIAHARALGALWTSGVTYHENARSTPAVIPHPYRQIFDQIPHSTPFFVLVIVAAIVSIGFVVLRRPLGVWPLWLWVVLGVAFLFLHAPLHYNHLIVFPFTLAIAAGATFGAAVERLPRLPGLTCIAVLVVAIATGWIQQLHRVDSTRKSEPASNIAAANALERLTQRNALVVDDRPIISFLAKRRVVGQLVDLAVLRFETGSLTDQRVIGDLRDAQAVVASRVLRRRPAVMRYLRGSYHLRYDHSGVQIYVH